MNPCTLLSTPESVTAALRYLHERQAAHKLREPVPVLFHNPRHAEAIRRRRAASADGAPVSWRHFLPA